MVASRWPWRLDFLAAAIKRSISAVVRYSRMRTEEFTVVGADRRPVCFPTIFCPRSKVTSELSIISSLVSIGAVGILANPGPETAWRAEALATLPLASIQRRGRSIPLLRRRPRTGLDQAGSTPELRRPIARRARLLIICSATSGYGNDADTADQADSPVPRTRCTSCRKRQHSAMTNRVRDRGRPDVAHLAWRDRRRARRCRPASSPD